MVPPRPTNRTPSRPLSDVTAPESQVSLLLEEDLNLAGHPVVNNRAAIRVKQERQLHREMLKFMGRPYWVRSSAWTLPMAMLVGVILGVSSFCLLQSSTFFRLHPKPNTEHLGMGFSLLLRLTLGGFLAGICLYALPSSPRIIRHFYHDLVDLQLDPNRKLYSAREAFWLVFGGWILLAAGAPLGPEMVWTAFASLLVTIFRTHGGFSKRYHRRTVASWLQAALAASLACIMPSLLGTLVAVLELTITARPHDMTLDAALLQKRAPSQTNHSSNDNGNNETADNNPQLQAPLISSQGTIYRPSRHLSSLEHDFMELLFLSTIMAVCASTVHVKLHEVVGKQSNVWQDFQHTLLPNPQGTIAVHYLLAIPLGIVGGIIGTLTLLLAAMSRRIRSKFCRVNNNNNKPSKKAQVFLSVVAGGVVTSLCLPQLEWMDLTEGASDGSLLSLELLRHQDSIGAWTLVIIGLCQIVILVVSLGFGGWLGGVIFLLTSVGVCCALVTSKLFLALPMSLVVPCSIASVIGSIIPVPFAIAISLVQLFGLHVENGGPVLVAALVAHGVTGGLGLTRYCGRRMSGLRSGYNSEEEEEEELVEQFSLIPTDDEIVRDIRSQIFGRGSLTV
ncbi:Ankyrin Repeat [Seminavis robusta]|uniref:Ankyrin Repeat n=1 Tax=Seminavis robusta TaxID=568900 RepID=A0A9N8EAK6_9STRA|nr:Ankyrin Repeat [Seminavis robusta]|eukprot:Sro691_g187890.1 Ankyrin Repeat (618) ;mRNA; f:33835-35688